MVYRVLGDTVAIRLDKMDKIAASIQEVCRRERIVLGTVSGLGAVCSAEIGMYRLSEQRFCARMIEEEMELVSLTGNITQNGESTHLHLHAVFSDAQGRAWGGHLIEAVISLTGEIFVRRLDGEISRTSDPETGLRIMEL